MPKAYSRKGVGWGKDCYEAWTGKSLLTGEDRDKVSRTMAIIGAATVGMSHIATESMSAVAMIGGAI